MGREKRERSSYRSRLGRSRMGSLGRSVDQVREELEGFEIFIAFCKKYR